MAGEELPLAGFTVGVTADRRGEELCALLERRGAKVLHAPAMRTIPLADDTDLLAATRDVVESPPDIVVVETGVGFSGWLEAVDGWDLGERLRTVLGDAALLTRGPKATGAVRAADLAETWSPSSESSAEMLDHLLARGVAGKRIAVQLHGEPLTEFCDALRGAGAEVVPVPVYRWTAPADTAPLDRMVREIVDGTLDAVTFTSAPAAAGLLSHADAVGRGEELREALRGGVLAMCVGPVTAAPLQDADIPTVLPARSRTGAMVRTLAEELARR